MTVLLLVPVLALTALAGNACWALATQRPHTPATNAPLTGSPVETLASGLQTLVGRHPDGSSHSYTTPVPAGLHACGPGVGYCHHEAVACRCGQRRLTGHFVEEVR